jgi:hypothetical protein
LRSLNERPGGGGAEQVFARFLDLERQTRAARDASQLAYSLVNDGQALFGYRHAALLIAGKVQAVTGVSSGRAECAVRGIRRAGRGAVVQAGWIEDCAVITPEQVGEAIQADWRSLSAAKCSGCH